MSSLEGLNYSTIYKYYMFAGVRARVRYRRFIFSLYILYTIFFSSATYISAEKK